MADIATYYHVLPSGDYGRGYSLMADDIEWLAKAFWGECQSGDETQCGAVAWTMIRRWLLWPGEPSKWMTFAEFMRAFSEPLQPRKLDQGSPEVRARRAKIQTAEWAEIPINARKHANAFAVGRLPDPVPWAVDFASASWMDSRGASYQGKVGDNGFVDQEHSGQRWLSGAVSVVGAGGGGVDVDDDEPIDPEDQDQDEVFPRPFGKAAMVATCVAALAAVVVAAVLVIARTANESA